MEKLGLLALTFVLSCGVVGATFGKGFLYPFEINELLVCHQQNPFAHLPGQPQQVESPIIRVPFDVPKTNTETDPASQIWLPRESGFRMPSLHNLDEEALMKFLGNDFNKDLMSVIAPPADDVPPKACDLIPAIEGSAGNQLIHLEEDPEFISLLAVYKDPRPENAGEDSLIFQQVEDTDPANSQIRDLLANFVDRDFETVGVVVSQTNSRDELCDLWVAKCPLTPRWVELPVSYFPPYLAISTCSQKNCSFPRGLTCQEDFTYTVYVTVLRWDCCFNTINRETRWDCGWRKVQIPIFCDCTCGCREVYQGQTG